MNDGDTLIFAVDCPGELAAGISPYTNTVTIMVSYDPGGYEDRDFAKHMRKSLEEWFEGAKVTLL